MEHLLLGCSHAHAIWVLALPGVPAEASVVEPCLGRTAGLPDRPHIRSMACIAVLLNMWKSRISILLCNIASEVLLWQWQWQCSCTICKSNLESWVQCFAALP